jgi:hypothetical protein
VTNVSDPDLPKVPRDNPPSYAAMRMATSLYVEYVDGEREYYDVGRDPEELANTVGQLSQKDLAAFSQALAALQGCHSGQSCVAAQQQAVGQGH